MARFRLRRMSTLESAMFLAMFALLLSYSCDNWLETVRMESVDVENTIAPNSTKMPKRVLRKSFRIRMSCGSGCVTRTWLPSR